MCDSSASIYQVVGLQAYIAMPDLCSAGDQTQGFTEMGRHPPADAAAPGHSRIQAGTH